MSQLGQQGAREKGVIRHPGASQKVLAYLRAHPDVTIPYAEIEAALHYPGYAVSNSITHLTSKGVHLERPIRGMVVYRSSHEMPAAPPNKTRDTRLFEYIGQMKDRAVIRGEDDQLYVAIPLEAFYRKDT
jgi:hypothetical protein